MTTFLAYLGRLMAISFGFIVATFVALIVVSLQVWVQPDPLETILTATALAMGMVFLGSALGSGVGLLFFVLIGISEYRSWRDWLTYALAGGVITGGTMLVFAGGRNVSDLALMAAAGLAGGITYWLVAGRNAGKLLERIVAEREQ